MIFVSKLLFFSLGMCAKQIKPKTQKSLIEGFNPDHDFLGVIFYKYLLGIL